MSCKWGRTLRYTFLDGTVQFYPTAGMVGEEEDNFRMNFMIRFFVGNFLAESERRAKRVGDK
jgi:hypothetical protein